MKKVWNKIKTIFCKIKFLFYKLKNSFNNKNIHISFIELAILLLITSVIMSSLTGTLIYNKLNKNGKVTTTNNKHVNEFIGVYNKLLDEYFEDLDENKLIDAAIDGMLNYTGDDYTIYLNEDATSNLNDKLEGTYDGIGISISLTETYEIYIVEVFENSPAHKAGLAVGDIIKSINGESVENKNTEEASNIIKNSKDKKVNIVVNRNGEELSFDLEIKTLIVPAITSSIKDINGHKIGYIYLETFSGTVDTQVQTTLISMEQEGIESLIIDVRGNTGGYLSSCTKTIEMFLEKDKLMYSIKSKKDSTDYKDTTDTKRTYPIVVLINGNSASASEILAGSLKYSYGATIIGTKSFGKGKVQTTGTLEDGTMIKYTSARWFMPNGECIDEKGIKPDIEIELSEDYKNNPVEENDNQLNEAIKVLTS